MSNINISKENIEIKDEEYISKIYKNFDPFLSAGIYIKVKFTDEGVKLLNRAINNRPKIIEDKCDLKNNVYVFECHPKLAEVYFPQFFYNAEIIEPIEMRERFKKNVVDMYEKYF